MWVTCYVILINQHDRDLEQTLIKQKSSLYCHFHGLSQAYHSVLGVHSCCYRLECNYTPAAKHRCSCQKLTNRVGESTDKDNNSCKWHYGTLGGGPIFPLFCVVAYQNMKLNVYVIINMQLNEERFFLLTLSQFIQFEMNIIQPSGLYTS